MAKKRVQVEGVSAPTLKNSIGGLGQTFVSPEVNPRGAQIANALSSVIAPAVQQKVDEYQENVRYVDGLKAKNQFALLEPSLKEHMANADYSIKEQADGSIRRLTADEHFATWAQADEYQAALGTLGSKTAQQALEHSIGQSLASGYGTGAVAYDQEELRQTLSQSLQVGLSQGQLPAADVWANYDASLVNTNLMDRQEAMEQLLLSAEKTLRDTGSTSGFDYIESRGMGNDAWKMRAEDTRDAALAEILRKEEADDRRNANALVKAKYAYESEVSQILDADPDADLTDVISKAVQDGIPNAKRLADGYSKDYSTSSEIVLSPDKEAKLRHQFFQLTTTKQRDQFLLNNASIIPKELRTHLRSNVATFNGYDKDKAYTQQLKLMSDLVEEFGEEDQYHSIINQFSIDYAVWFDSDDYQSTPVSARPAKAQELLKDAAAGLGVKFDDAAFVQLNVGGTTQEIIEQRNADEETKERLQAEFDALTK